MKTKKLLSVMLMLTAVVMLSTQAIADTITCPTTADVYIDQGSPTTNFNNKTRVLVSWHATKGIARGLLKFDIPSDIEASNIESAIMHVSKNSTAGAGVQITVSVYALNSFFGEATETWNTHSGGDYDTSVVSNGTLPSWTTEITQATLDVTTLLAGNLNKVRNNGILIKITDESGTNVNQNFASKEDVDPYFDPYLEIVCKTTTAVTLASFDATPGSGAVTLNWQTGDETDNFGFNIYRSQTEDGEYITINDSSIISKAETGSGASYVFVDENVYNRQTYFYMLEDIDTKGQTTLHGPVSATPRLIFLFK